MRKEILDFIEFAKNKTKEYDVKLELRDVKYFVLRDEAYAKCHGYFDGTSKELKCAIGKHYSKWVPILVHEYSHFEQWVEKCPAWENADCKEDETGYDYFLWVMNKKDIPHKTVSKILAGIRELELDCEKRAYKNIKKYDLPLNRDSYAQSANAYIHFYNWALERRMWYKPKKCPYQNRIITKQMPTKIRGDYSKTPEWIFDIFDKYCV